MLTTKQIILDQMTRYPGLRAGDVVKALYQSVFGCGHMLSDDEAGMKRLLDEMNAPNLGTAAEPLGDDYVRAHIGAVRDMGMKPETLYALFKLSCVKRTGTVTAFENAVSTFESMCDGKEAPFSRVEIEKVLFDIRARDFGPVSHTTEFRSLYAPAYRVIAREYGDLLKLFCDIDSLKNEPAIIAIDGECASGKTTLAKLLSKVYGCQVFHMDDFFLRPCQRTRERLACPGENVDHERFLNEVLEPLKRGEPFSYRPYDCSTGELAGEIRALPSRINVVEGAYSLHMALSGFYDYTVFMSADKGERLKRILDRNGARMLDRFVDEWIPMEEAYFAATDIEKRCDLIIRNQEAIA